MMIISFNQYRTKVIVSIIVGVVLLASCGSKKQIVSTPKQTDFFTQLYQSGVIFYAVGQEPYWNLKFTDKDIRYEGMNNQTFTIQSKFILPKGSRATWMNFKMPNGNLGILVSSSIPCKDSLMRKQYPYCVIGNSQNNDFILNGCGKNIYDFNINGKWQLKKINNKDISSQLDSTAIPTIEIDGEIQTISGYTGCNIFNGSFLIRGNEINMGNLATTIMACPNDIEVAFLAAFNNIYSYKYNNGILTLMNLKGVSCQFERVGK